ncbi:HalOD1 output domain-containing protein [Salinigranum sp.]|uniref:HalOD1 output domain-containing protein n=1 Tax=Salinigranum sp. TaxID=1966351 RepID=UPI00356391B9
MNSSRRDARGLDLSVRIANEVAAAKGVDPMDLDPLSAVVDLESLDTLVANSAASLRLEWCMDDLTIEVVPDGEVRVSQTPADADVVVDG